MPAAKVSLLFWNIHQNRPVQNIVRLVQRHAIDILLLAESPFNQEATDLLDALNAAPRLPDEQKFIIVAPSKAKRVQVFSQLSHAEWTLEAEHSRLLYLESM